ncbi:Sorbitol dehydrogenase [Geodia barretti]|uniref:Sorbitol dehydrogenase n=1 Tax=Geodia barretti TaxID=519541 RepID=A0AA35WTS6_GEOBA|nr:Sorbitol dehydrogenase [Geodia barretti]
MATMRGALFDGDGGMEVRDIPRPEAGRGDVVVRVRSVGICGSDLQMNVDKTEPDRLPAGHEVAGEIVEIGDDVDPALLGERVAVEIIDMAAPARPAGGGFAEFMKRRAIGCYPVGDLSWEDAALVEAPGRVHPRRPAGTDAGGEVVAVLGSGNIGLTSIAAAKALGAGKVIATARYEQQASLAKILGADEVYPDKGSDFWDAIAESTGGRGADLTIETVGGHQSATATQAVEVTRVQGRIVVVGGFRRPFEFDFLTPMLKEQSIVFSSCYSVLDGRHDYELP